ncbi:MAG: sigma-70 family RNA polymerase sigma factor [Planctomycetes bacterium]|nr:sigma-70 family RNA polymerase sigma factor [Planctomycetota bacterium]
MVASRYVSTGQIEATHKERGFWYVPAAEIQTASAARAARRLADGLDMGRRNNDEGIDEHAVFVALHTAAYRAGRQTARRRGRSAKTGTDWPQTWARLRDYLVQQNIPLVYSMIAGQNPRDQNHDDLLSDALYGLLQAVERFDPWRGFRFSTYAWHAIKRSMIRRRKSCSRYRRLFAGQQESYMEQPGAKERDDGLYIERLRCALDDNAGELTDMESAILARRFPQNDQPRSTLQQIGSAVGLSKERVRQLQNSALQKLREVLAADALLQ